MVTQKEEMTIYPTPTANARNFEEASRLSGGFPEPTAPVSKIVNFDPNAPFALLNSSLILPYNTSAPTNALILEDPANIIFSGQHNLLVESLGSLQNDCVQLATTNSLINQAIQLSLFNSLQQAAAAQFSNIHIGGGIPIIPPDVLLSHPDLASQYSQALATETATATTDTAVAMETATTTDTAVATETGTETSTEATLAPAPTEAGGHEGKGRKGSKPEQAQ